MTKFTVIALILCCSVAYTQGFFWRPLMSCHTERCYPCYWLRRPREVTLVVKNILREPFFTESVTLDCTRYKTLFYMMMDAADINPAFKFTATYFKDLGFFINAMNGLAGNYTLDKSFWAILDGDDKFTPVGVSSYEPSDGETVTFNFTQGSDH